MTVSNQSKNHLLDNADEGALSAAYSAGVYIDRAARVAIFPVDHLTEYLDDLVSFTTATITPCRPFSAVLRPITVSPTLNFKGILKWWLSAANAN